MDTQAGWDATACGPTTALATGTEPPRNSPKWLGRLLSMDDARKTALRFFKAATEAESSGDEFGILEDDRCIDTGIFQRRYRARIGVCLWPAPTAAIPDQLHHPDSSRLACRSRSGPLRAGTPPSHHDRGVGISSVLALIGARDGDSEDKNKCACAVVGLGYLPQSRAAVLLKPDTRRSVSLGANHAMQKKEVHCAA